MKTFLTLTMVLLVGLAVWTPAQERPAAGRPGTGGGSGTGGVYTNEVLPAVIATFYTNTTPHYIEGLARLGTTTAGRIQASVTNSDNSMFFQFQEEVATAGASSNGIAFKVPPGGWWKFIGLTTTATDGSQVLTYNATNGAVSFATRAGTATTATTATLANNIAAGATLNPANGFNLSNVLARTQPYNPISGTNLDSGFGDRVLFVGDSLMIDNDPWWPLLATNVLGFFGTNGWFGSSSTPGHPLPAHLTDAAAGAGVTRNSGGGGTPWYGIYYTLPDAGVHNFYHNTQTYIRANIISVPYLTVPGGGIITVLKINSGGTTTLGEIDTDAALGSGYTNFTFATDDCFISLTNSSGADVNYIAPGLWDTNGAGFRFGSLGKGGMDDWITNYTARAGALTALNPTKVVYHQVGGGTNILDTGVGAGWALFIQSNQTIWPNADVYVCIPWSDSTDAEADPLKGGTPAERRILRAMAITNGWYLVDFHGAFGSWNTITNRGLVDDGTVHASFRLARLAASYFVDNVGWFKGLNASFGGVEATRTNHPWATKAYVQQQAAQSITASQLASWDWMEANSWMLGQNATLATGATAGTGYVNAQPFWTDWIRLDDNVANAMIQRSVPFGLGWKTNVLTAYVAWTNSVSCRVTNTALAIEYGATRTITTVTFANDYVQGLNTIVSTNVWTVDNVPRVIQWGHSDNTNGASLFFLGAKIEWR